MKCPCRHTGEAEVKRQPIRNPAPEGGGWSAPHSGCFTPEKQPVPIVQEAGWALGLVSTARKIAPEPGFDPWTVQSIMSHNTDYTILATTAIQGPSKLLWAHQGWIHQSWSSYRAHGVWADTLDPWCCPQEEAHSADGGDQAMGPALPIHAPEQVCSALVFHRFMGLLLSHLDNLVLHLATDVKHCFVTSWLQADSSKVQSTLV